MAARKVNTPGAPEKAPEPVSTAEQADAALEHITGQDAESQDQSTNETSSLGTPVEDDRLDQILENQKRIESKLDQLLKAGGIEAKKKTRWVQGKHGLEQKEI